MWSACFLSHAPEGEINDIINNFHAALARCTDVHGALRRVIDSNAMAVVIIDRADSQILHGGVDTGETLS